MLLYAKKHYLAPSCGQFDKQPTVIYLKDIDPFFLSIYSQIPLEAFRRPGPTRIPKPKAYSTKGTNSVVNPGQSNKGQPQTALSSEKALQGTQSAANNLNMVNRPTRI